MILEQMTTDELLQRRAFLKREIKRLEQLDALRSVEEHHRLRDFRAERRSINRKLSLKIVQLPLF